MTATQNKKEISISINWVTLENQVFASSYILSDEQAYFPFEEKELAEYTKTNFIDALHFEVEFIKMEQVILKAVNELLPNGNLKTTQYGTAPNGNAYINTEIYHKQLSVMPYSTSVSCTVIKAAEECVIRYKALTAIEEQTNMQLSQIRKQIELLAIKAQEIQLRKELTHIAAQSTSNFKIWVKNC